ncbi:MAG: hypothetical protein JXJ04_20055 [Spirochaetales bacterium]|nr:hypothetical protein [Spirochaetales bacterium]
MKAFSSYTLIFKRVYERMLFLYIHIDKAIRVLPIPSIISYFTRKVPDKRDSPGRIV